jgi:hypothetical protein
MPESPVISDLTPAEQYMHVSLLLPKRKAEETWHQVKSNISSTARDPFRIASYNWKPLSINFTMAYVRILQDLDVLTLLVSGAIWTLMVYFWAGRVEHTSTSCGAHVNKLWRETLYQGKIRPTVWDRNLHFSRRAAM